MPLCGSLRLHTLVIVMLGASSTLVRIHSSAPAGNAAAPSLPVNAVVEMPALMVLDGMACQRFTSVAMASPATLFVRSQPSVVWPSQYTARFGLPSVLRRSTLRSQYFQPLGVRTALP